MTALTSNYGSSVWATKIAVAAEGDHLSISGRVPFSDSDLESAEDLFVTYLQNRESANKGARNQSAHLQFANAQTDEDLIDFVKRFGPVSAHDVNLIRASTVGKAHAPFTRDLVTSLQRLVDLRREQRIYKACLRLVGELSRGEKDVSLGIVRECVSLVVQGISHWQTDWDRESASRRMKKQGPPRWQFGNENYEALLQLQAATVSDPVDLAGYIPFRAAHEVLCGILNAFPTRIEILLDRPVEALPYEALLYGVRPLLYLILRHEYLTQVGVGVCANSACSRFFVIERLNQQFCDETCSRRSRQRQYWAQKGSELRAQRRRKSTLKKRGK
jgi:hypothetical protein